MFTAGTAGTFTITTVGFPTTAINGTGTLPDGVILHDNGDGTATLTRTGWFNEYLGRAPTPDEQAHYVNQMLAGASDRDIEEAIKDLPEYAGEPPSSPAGTAARLPDYLP